MTIVVMQDCTIFRSLVVERHLCIDLLAKAFEKVQDVRREIKRSYSSCNQCNQLDTKLMFPKPKPWSILLVPFLDDTRVKTSSSNQNGFVVQHSFMILFFGASNRTVCKGVTVMRADARTLGSQDDWMTSGPSHQVVIWARSCFNSLDRLWKYIFLGLIGQIFGVAKYCSTVLCTMEIYVDPHEW